MDPASDKSGTAAQPTSDPVDKTPVPLSDNDTAASIAANPATAETTTAPAPNTDSGAVAPVRTSNGSGKRSQGPSLDIDTNGPNDFEGEVQTNNELPSAELLRKTENYIVLDRDGKTHTFKSLYTGPNVPRRVLVIFVRHFFCGNCQEYLRTVAESITPESLLSLPVSTFITVVGCGDPRLIDMYARETGCPFPIYTDPKGHLFSALGMIKTLQLGEKPAYMRKSVIGGALSSIGQGLKHISSGLALKSGDHRQVGGELLFEPLNIATPITTPQDEKKKEIGAGGLDQGVAGESGFAGGGVLEGFAEEKKVSWCHRMRSTRDHTELPELMEVLGLEGHGKPADDPALWKKALATRKGTGSSLAADMSELTNAQR